MAVVALTNAADFRIEAGVIATSPRAYYLTQSRSALIPGNPARVIITTQETEKTGAHGYRDLFSLESPTRAARGRHRCASNACAAPGCPKGTIS